MINCSIFDNVLTKLPFYFANDILIRNTSAYKVPKSIHSKCDSNLIGINDARSIIFNNGLFNIQLNKYWTQKIDIEVVIRSAELSKLDFIFKSDYPIMLDYQTTFTIELIKEILDIADQHKNSAQLKINKLKLPGGSKNMLEPLQIIKSHSIKIGMEAKFEQSKSPNDTNISFTKIGTVGPSLLVMYKSGEGSSLSVS